MRVIALGCVALATLLSAEAMPRTQSDADLLERVRQEGMDRSHVHEYFATLTDQFGARLTASPAFKQAAEWARDRLREFGLSDARLEAWPFGRGWVLDHLTIEMVEPRYMPLIGYADAWSPSTSGEIVATPVMVGGQSATDVAALRDKLRGAIVLLQPEPAFIKDDRQQPTTASGPVRIGAPPPPGARQNPADAQQIAETVRAAGAALIVRTSYGEHGTVFVQRRDQGPTALPSIVLTGEHYGMIVRLLQRGTPVKLRVDIRSHYLTDDTNGYNVVAEIPGSDPQLRREVVMIGAHLDSWHTGEGAADNADGAASTLEAIRILQSSGARPKRTIRVALWGGEEEGLLGSKAYVAQHLAGDANRAAREALFVYLNQDPGYGPIYGWYLENTPAVESLFDRWLEPLKPLGARRNVLPGIGATDHLSFRAAGMPGFNAIQEYADYDVRIHHTNMDMPERVREQDLKQSAVVLAWFALQAANTTDRIPRPAEAGGR